MPLSALAAAGALLYTHRISWHSELSFFVAAKRKDSARCCPREKSRAGNARMSLEVETQEGEAGEVNLTTFL